MTVRAQIEREDIVNFINAAFTCTDQREFYETPWHQTVSIDFLHEYMRVNYRLLYSRCLALGINHANTRRIIFDLLRHGRDQHGYFREEGRLIRAALRALPPQRVYHLFRDLRRARVNNRRTRAVVREYMTQSAKGAFHAIKYRRFFRDAARHNHLKLQGEIDTFIFRGSSAKRRWNSPLLENFRRAAFDSRAIYALPFTIAEGLAQRKGIPREKFLAKAEHSLTQAERLRLQQSAREANWRALDLDQIPLTKLAIYVLALENNTWQEGKDCLMNALCHAAHKVTHAKGLRLGKVAAVLDNSYSSSGSHEKRRRPLAVTWATHFLLQAAAQTYRPFWTNQPRHGRPHSRGQTDLATPLLQALAWEPDTILVISDGYENAPTGGVGEVVRLARERLKSKVIFLHFNPVYQASDYMPKSLSPDIPTLGLRDAEDVAAMLPLARFAAGQGSLSELYDFLSAQARAFIHRHEA